MDTPTDTEQEEERAHEGIILVHEEEEQDHDSKSANEKAKKSCIKSDLRLVLRDLEENTFSVYEPHTFNATSLRSNGGKTSSFYNAKLRSSERGAARQKNRQSRRANEKEPSNEEVPAGPHGSVVETTDSSSTFPGAVAIPWTASSFENSIDADSDVNHGNIDYDGVKVGFGTDDHSYSEQAPALIMATRLVFDEPSVPDFLEEHLERRIQESVQAQFQAQQQLYNLHLNAIADEVVPTGLAVVDRSPQLLMHQRNLVFAESILPTHEASNENHRNAVDDNTPSRGFFFRSWGGLLVLLLIMVATVSGVAIGLTLQKENSTNPETEPPSSTTMPTMSAVVAPSSSPTMSLVEMLKPSIVRNDADLALLTNNTSPQWHALDWLSRDSIALIENQSPSTILNRYVLAVLYYATNGNHWGPKLGYLEPTSVCEWNNGDAWGSGTAVGVYCVQQSSVQQIRIFKRGLRGTVPWELSLLGSLEFLDLSESSLTGTLPPELGNLTSLQYIYLQQSSVTGTLPTEIGRLTSLRYFWSDENAITGPLPTEIGQMVGLEIVRLQANALNGTLPTEIGLLSALQMLHVDDNNLSGALPTEIGQMVGLQTAVFAHNAFNGTLPTEIGQLSALELFAVDFNNLSGTLPTELGQLTSLSEGWFRYNRFVGTVPTEFSQLRTLTKLSFEKNNLTGSVDDIVCSSQWEYLGADCAPDTTSGSTLEIQCSCCTTCCDPSGTCAVVNN